LNNLHIISPRNAALRAPSQFWDAQYRADVLHSKALQTGSVVRPARGALKGNMGVGEQAGVGAGVVSARLPMTANFRVERLRSPADLAALGAASDALAQRMSPRSPFATSTWLAHWWRHYNESRVLVRDRFFAHSVRDERGQLIAIAPWILTERPGWGPLRSRNLYFFGSDKSITELRGLICAREDEPAVVRALLAHLHDIRSEWDWLVWSGVPNDSGAHRLLSNTENFSWGAETIDHVLELPATWEEFRSSRSRNIKESLRKCYNSLKRDGHVFTFRVVADPAVMPGALHRFFELHGLRAVAPNFVRHADVFYEQRARQLILDLAAQPNETLSMRVFQLEIGGKVIASRLAFVLGDELYLYFSGYEPEWGAYSVMTTTVAEAIKWAIENRFRAVNLSPGTDVSKTRWGAQATTTCNGILVSPTPRAKLVFRVLNELNQRSRPGTLLGNVLNRARRIG
jgi:Acetyltransferase (GNAT) domain